MNKIEKLNEVVNEIDSTMLKLSCVQSSIIVMGEACKTRNGIIDDLECSLMMTEEYLDDAYNAIDRSLMEVKDLLKNLEHDIAQEVQ